MNRIGNRYGRLVVLEKFSSGIKKKKIQARWLCQCDCGKQKIVSSGNLTGGGTKSCGCLRSETSKTKATKHGLRDHPEYYIWCGMVGRCHGSKGIRATKYYKARGIVVCDRWRENFANFYADMGPRPSKSHSIERIDNNGDYEPGNCRWATRSEQMTNRRWGAKFKRNEYAFAALSFGG